MSTLLFALCALSLSVLVVGGFFFLLYARTAEGRDMGLRHHPEDDGGAR